MKIKKPPMPLWQKILYIVLFITMLYLFIYLGTKNYNAPKKSLTDQESFTEEYGISKDNIFVYKNAIEILETLNSGSALIFMAFPTDFSREYASMINEIAKENNIKQIYYYNFLKDRKNNNHYYENIVNILESYTYILDDNTKNIYSPTFLIVKNGKIIYFDNETSITRGEITVKEYWTDIKKANKKSLLNAEILKYQGLIYEK